MCGVPQSDEFALHWYRAAAELGDPEGQFMLAVCYAQGIGTEADIRQAAI